MKTKFSTFDLACEIAELQVLVGMRVNKVYDVDKKTYIVKLQKPEDKRVLIIESGARIHSSSYEWPKNDAPSGFTMKLRKHINNKRLEKLTMIENDRIIDLQFGSGDAAQHLIVELYDKGNLILTDKDLVILNVLRPRVQGEEKFLVRETYSFDQAKKVRSEAIPESQFLEILSKSKPSDSIKKLFLSQFDHGPALLEHFLQSHDLLGATKIKDLKMTNAELAATLVQVFSDASKFLETSSPKKGYIVMKSEQVPDLTSGDGETVKELTTYDEFHPVLFNQHKNHPFKEFDSFDQAIDEFFSQLESQRIDVKVHQQERQALKKLENIRLDHTQRLTQLQKDQLEDRHKGELIEMNSNLVDKALMMIRSAIANQMDWKEIEEVISEASESGDPILSRVRNLRLDINHFSILLWDPYAQEFDSDNEESEENDNKPALIELDLDLSAQGNARKYYVKKKSAAMKELKTIESQSVAMKSAEKKTKQMLREVAVTALVTKARKTFWFEKFYWFVSTENYLVIAGRDQQQNELVVKRYMRPGDIYVHADLHGAASVIVKNPSGKPVPPKTLNEAGHMAICYSVAWDSKVVTSAWWVESSQVSKSAPSGEYLPTGSFMVRGKKNFLPPSHLILGYGILFRVSDDNIKAHANDRKVRIFDESNIIKEEEEPIEEEQELEVGKDEELGDVDEEQLEEEGLITKTGVKPEQVDRPDTPDLIPAVKTEPENAEAESKEDNPYADSSSSDDDDEKETIPKSEFPDTEIKIDYSTSGKMVEFKAQCGAALEEPREQIHFVEKKDSNKNADKQNQKPAPKDQEKEDRSQKRGKKGKMKKVKGKYKDQTEDERELAMQILQGKPKEEKTEKPKKEDSKKSKSGPKPKIGPKFSDRPKPVDQGGEEHMKEVEPANDEVDMLDSLVSIPLPDDELLFALPMVGPYNSMLTWKFKVKATPGTSKRGKAVKTAMNMFMTDRATTAREKDLLRSMKEQDLARNLPGKVKLSAPQLHKNK